MNNNYLNQARKVITDPQVLTIVASRRAKQLAMGGRPMVKSDSTNYLDIALQEIAEGLLSYEFGDENPAEAEETGMRETLPVAPGGIPDEKERLKEYAALEKKIIREDASWIPLFSRTHLYVTGERVDHFEVAWNGWMEAILSRVTLKKE